MLSIDGGFIPSVIVLSPAHPNIKQGKITLKKQPFMAIRPSLFPVAVLESATNVEIQNA
jgi:hypothetical protein